MVWIWTMEEAGRPHQQPYTVSVRISPRGLPASPSRHESYSPFNIFALAIHLYPCQAHCHHSSRHTKVSSAGIHQSDGLSPRSLTVASLGFIFLRGTYCCVVLHGNIYNPVLGCLRGRELCRPCLLFYL